jgi:hypothetical protein
MASSGMLRRVALVITDVSEELGASIIRVTRIGELGTTLAVTSNRRTLTFLVHRYQSPCYPSRFSNESLSRRPTVNHSDSELFSQGAGQ